MRHGELLPLSELDVDEGLHLISDASNMKRQKK